MSSASILPAYMTRLVIFFAFLILFLSWLIPSHHIPWRSAPQELLAFIAAGLLIMASVDRVVAVPLALSLFFLVSVSPLLQYWSGTIFFLGDAVVTFLYIAFFCLTIVASYNLSRAERPPVCIADALMFTLVVGAVFSALLSIKQWLLQSDDSWIMYMAPGMRPYANLGQPNNLATLLGMGLAGLVYFFEKRIISRFFSSFVCVLVLLGMALTQSRAGWLSFFLICLFWVFKVCSAGLSSRLKVKSIFCWMMVFAFFVFSIPFVGDFLYLKVATLSERLGSSGRLDLYIQFLAAVLDGPVFGYGWNQVSVAQVLVTADVPVSLMVSYTHNLFLDLVIWAGILGVLLVFLVCVWIAKLLFSIDSPITLSLFSATCFFLIHGMFEYPHAYAYLLLPVAILVGVLNARVPIGRSINFNSVFFVLVFSSVFLLGIFVSKEYWAVEKDYRNIQLEGARIIGSKRLVGCGPNVYFLTNLKAFACFSRLDIDGVLSPLQLEEVRKVALRYPFAPALYRYSLILAASGEEAKAYQQFMLLRGLYGEEVFLSYIEDLRLRSSCCNWRDLVLRLDKGAR